MVRTMGGAATTEGLGATAGDAWATAGLGEGSASATPGDGDADATATGFWRNAPLASSVGGRPGGVGAWLPGTAPRTGRSLAGPHALVTRSVAANNTR